MSTWIVVDNAPAARIVERVVNDSRIGVVNAKEYSTAMMKARSILLAKGQPTILLLDSDSLEERAIMEVQLEVGGYLQDSSRGVRNRLILAIPQVEAVLFTDRAGLENALGKKMSDEEAFEARFRPKAVFYRLLGKAPGKKDADEHAVAVIDAIDDTSLRRMAAHPVIREIQEFVDEVQRGSRPAKVRRAS